MKIILQDDKELLYFSLTKEVLGNFWISDSNNRNLVNIEAIDGKWVLKSNIDVKILQNNDNSNTLSNVNQIEQVVLSDYMSLYINELDKNKLYKVFCLPTYDNSVEQLVVDLTKATNISLGSSKKAVLNCSLPDFADEQLNIIFENKSCKVINNNDNIPMYINNIREQEKQIFNGDMIFIDGIIIYVIGNIIVINNPNNVIFYDSLKLAKRLLPTNLKQDYSTEQETFIEVFSKNEYFQRPPRFKRLIEEKEFNIDPPIESKKDENEMPLVYTMGPMALMATTAIMSGATAIMKVMSGEPLKDNLTPIIMACTMTGSTLVFPFLQKMYRKSSLAKFERKRRRKYKKYIDKKKNEILQEIEIQRQILIENNICPEDVAKIILNRERTLWDRKIEHPDFLTIRLGIGYTEPQIKIKIPEEHFTMDEDNLKDLYDDLFKDIKYIENIPVTVNLIDKQITGIVGEYRIVRDFLDGFLLQLMVFHSYDILKLVVLTSKEKKNTWEKYKNIPHFWNNDKTFRYVGIDMDDINKVSNSLVQILNERINNDNDQDKNVKEDEKEKYKKYKEYYVILCDEIDYIKNTTIFNELLKNDSNYGFSIVLITDKIDRLPNECSTFVSIDQINGIIFENHLVSTNQKQFVADIPKFNMNNCYLQLCNIPVDIAAGKFILPKQYSFLEMYDVGNVKQLNILNRWKNNNIIQSLEAPVGINEQGELFKIDLHEKAHGPHGLVAGMTGSGKSEWIISYILSMCVNYHPDEVQFVLIDYKGGGLAGTFENKETGFRLPHLAGTITNLDVSEINRCLASISSELKRRQRLFNSARDSLGESSMDIYKYQRLYRAGKITQPISHLFIISDEFAELKSQQPEFMAELISTARIGRSLGVHLILATQKPSGVVDDQIWSNSKFRVCLKVQEKSDSKDMILVPDAALLKEAGRFYLQVGYNEFFAKGQSAYAGAPYYESEKHKKTVDTNLEFMDNVGTVYKEINSEKKVVSAVFKGEELPNILTEISDCANSLNINVTQLWLDAIPPNIYITDLLKKYSYQKESYYLNPVIGEYDAPSQQKQDILTLPLSKEGNTLIYGVAGSGKENLLTSILYSLMVTYFSNEVNVYILDFGAEVLNCFKNSPIVGDIMTINDDDKVKKYFKFIMEETERRKKILQDYNGNYYYYCSKSEEKMPIILSIINNYDAYSEIYDSKFGEDLTKITREAEKFGILFIITANSVNSLRYKISQNFKQTIALQLNDTYDYKSIFGSACKLIPSTIKGRGIVKLNDDFYEFQTALPTEVDDLTEYLKDLSQKMLDKYKIKAQPIRTIPEIVDYEYIKSDLGDLSSFPIGVETEQIELLKYNFLDNKVNLILSEEEENVINFTKSIINLSNINEKKIRTILVDGNASLKDILDNKYYFNGNFDECLEGLPHLIDKVTDKSRQLLFVVQGLNNILMQNPNNQKLFADLLTKIKSSKKVAILLCESCSNISGFGNETWYYNNVNRNDGIFIGSGIDNQIIFNISKVSSEMRQELPYNFGYVVKKSKTQKVKTIEITSSII